jgi:hypothetical protein
MLRCADEFINGNYFVSSEYPHTVVVNTYKMSKSADMYSDQLSHGQAIPVTFSLTLPKRIVTNDV